MESCRIFGVTQNIHSASAHVDCESEFTGSKLGEDLVHSDFLRVLESDLEYLISFRDC
jgi:hypothetical protein